MKKILTIFFLCIPLLTYSKLKYDDSTYLCHVKVFGKYNFTDINVSLWYPCDWKIEHPEDSTILIAAVSSYGDKMTLSIIRDEREVDTMKLVKTNSMLERDIDNLREANDGNDTNDYYHDEWKKICWADSTNVFCCNFFRIYENALITLSLEIKPATNGTMRDKTGFERALSLFAWCTLITYPEYNPSIADILKLNRKLVVFLIISLIIIIIGVCVGGIMDGRFGSFVTQVFCWLVLVEIIFGIILVVKIIAR